MSEEKKGRRVVVTGTGPIGKVADLCKRIEDRDKKAKRDSFISQKAINRAKDLDW